MERECALYRLFGGQNDLLYVGISTRPFQRFMEHQHGKQWWPHVETVTVERYATIDAARKAEEAAILHEHPKFNVMHNDIANRLSDVLQIPLDIVSGIIADARERFPAAEDDMMVLGMRGLSRNICLSVSKLRHMEKLGQITRTRDGLFVLRDVKRQVALREMAKEFHSYLCNEDRYNCIPFNELLFRLRHNMDLHKGFAVERLQLAGKWQDRLDRAPRE